MTTTELELIRAALLKRREDPPASLDAARKGYDEFCEAFRAPDNCVFETVVLNGVSARVSICPQAKRSLIYAHGGGFLVGSAKGFQGIAGTLGDAIEANTYVVDYRLAPEHPYPAATDDFVAAYTAILEAGASASELVLAGDSAGAGLIVTSLLHAKRQNLPMPACVILFSPWVDLALTGLSIEAKAAVDCFLTPEKLRAGALAFLGPDLEGASFILDSDLSGFPPLLIQVGTDEILLDDAFRLARNAALAGNEVKLDVWSGMFHVWHAFAPTLLSARQALTAAANFADSVLSREKQ